MNDQQPLLELIPWAHLSARQKALRPFYKYEVDEDDDDAHNEYEYPMYRFTREPSSFDEIDWNLLHDLVQKTSSLMKTVRLSSMS